MFDRRTILAFLLIGLILIFYDDYLRLIFPPPPPSPSDTTGAVTGEEEKELTHQISPQRAWELKADEGEKRLQEISPAESVEERRIRVETEQIGVGLSSQGARITSLTIKPTSHYLKEEIELIPQPDSGALGWRFWSYGGEVETANLSFIYESSSPETLITLRGDQERDVLFRAQLDSARSLVVRYRFKGRGFTFKCEVEGIGTEDLFVRDYEEVEWRGGLAYTERDTAQDQYYSQAYAYFVGDVLEEVKVSKKPHRTGPATGKTRWIAIRNKYFLVAMIPEKEEGLAAWLENPGFKDWQSKFYPNRLSAGMRLALRQGSPSTGLQIYAGPLDAKLLRQVDPSLLKTMNWGWSVIAPISKAILWGLKTLYHLIPNYGVAVIVFSILIKLFTWPLTQASSRSMVAMQRLQPKMQALREKYKNDPQRLNREIMKLYKEEKINPAAGCFPMLLQLPVLYALFIVFRSTIEFRSAPFILWIKDLSMPDTLFHLPFTIPFYGDNVTLLPILMGISTYLQSKTSISDPNQKLFIYFMPVMMVVLFNSFPSGLTLYYTLFNVWSIVQYRLFPPPMVMVNKKLPAK